MTDREWRATEVLAYTAHDGPERPPSEPSTLLIGALGCTLIAATIGVLAANGLCEEHRAWVQVLAGVSLATAVMALVMLVRSSAAAPAATIVAAVPGIMIGALDAVHEPTRGAIVSAGFAVAALLAATVARRTAGAPAREPTKPRRFGTQSPEDAPERQPVRR